MNETLSQFALWLTTKMSIPKLKDKLRRKLFGLPHSYIEGLLDTSLNWDLRDDYAVYLVEFDEPEVEEALFQVASNSLEKDDIAESCGEALAEIWCRKGTLKIDALRKLKPAALIEALAILQVRKSEWLPALQQAGLVKNGQEQ